MENLQENKNNEEMAHISTIMDSDEEKPFFLNLEVKESKKGLSSKEVILSLLRVKAMKQVDLAEKIGMSRQGLNNYISGRWAVPTQVKIKIAEALGVDSSAIWDFLNSKENKK